MNGTLKRNNLDLLRFLFAGTVMLVHAHVLSGEAALASLSRWLSSEVAVKAFFVISGLLVFMSYENSGSLTAYLEKRARRIYPAYATVVIAAALLLFVSSTAPAADYAAGMLRYLAANLAFLNFVYPTLPGVFEGNLLREVNGALWTLKIEVMFYVSVPIFAWAFRKAGHLRVIAAVYVLSLAYLYGMGWMASGTGSATYVQLGRQLPGQLAYFMVGAFFFYYFDFFARRAGWFAAAALLLALAGCFLTYDPFEPFWLGTLVAIAAFVTYAGRFGRYGDFSYGMYILHFPVVQTLVWLGLFAWSPWAATAIAAMIVLCLAALLWHLVEKPWLKSSSHYRQEAAPAGAAPVEQKA